MALDNTVLLVGNVTRDPELRFTPNGTAVCTFGLAWNRRFDRGGERVEDTSFFDVTCWQSLAENVSESITKGLRVIVSGRLDQRSWETSEGDRRSKVEVVADEVAPRLRWASATVQRNEFRGSDGASYGGGRSANGGGRATVNSGSSSSSDGRTYAAGEEPF